MMVKIHGDEVGTGKNYEDVVEVGTIYFTVSL